ncbi:hypothetical protein [Xanthomonas vesicatoria]|uniref:hypothetical protein n=1 Tax=Xanthomonas vesicatoria TaxID=56460 RepID=UPI000731EF04|nr:hypothetical protein [Xanthomonas vesicatoria]KTF36955.1 hypothetical protein LMG919_09165 [Xanthomonas vesicatoria]MCC8559382.1 hypothetical protein [Xanthomonas vesicatoria]MCC8602358.1 hypothetical protein [Xanthomonas vesicatoria]MCC8610901.1 hypothetical protein [Xanthomonas vesicatoria]MCC8675607.1 hypothetical protein [Xanthomonas vesicatoria]
MTDRLFAPIPSTAELLTKIKKPSKQRSNAAEVVRWSFYLLIALVVAMGISAGLSIIGLLSVTTTRSVLTVLMTIVALTFWVWLLAQTLDVFLTLKAEYRLAAAEVDENILLEQGVISTLMRCDPLRLREHAKLMDLRAKILTRRSQMGAAVSAVCAVLIKLREAGEKAAVWGTLQDVDLFVLAASLGVLIGAAAVFSFSGNLERLSCLMMLAADRTDAGIK